MPHICGRRPTSGHYSITPHNVMRRWSGVNNQTDISTFSVMWTAGATLLQHIDQTAVKML